MNAQAGGDDAAPGHAEGPDHGEIRARPLAGKAELDAAVALQREIWGDAFGEIAPAALLWATQRVGGVASGAFTGDGMLVGLVFGISGWRDGRRAHWSDLLAVRPALRGRGVGTLLKAHQRALLLEAGVETVGWTFDPLESRNAHINFARLGITAHEYIRDLYGESASPLHQGLGTDRLVADWRIASGRVEARMGGRERAPVAADIAALPAAIRVRAAAGGAPEPTATDLALDADRLRLAVPADIQAVKQASPGLGAAWRAFTRGAFETYLGRGYVVEELVRGGATSDYVLTRTSLLS